MASHALVFGHSTPPGRRALAATDSEGPPVAGRGGSVPSFPGRAAADCLAPEREGLGALGLPASVIDTMQESRAPSTRAAYCYCWGLFAAWCAARGQDPHGATVDVILSFLQSQLEAGRAAATLCGLVAAIKAVRLGRSAISDADAVLISRFLRGARRLTARAPGSAVPPWDLDLVLGALAHPPFEPLHEAGLKWLSLKTAFLLAITSARRIGELQALSVHRDCCRWLPDGQGVVLRPNPAFLPKSLSDFHLSQSVELRSAPTGGLDQEAAQRLRALCPIRALALYIARTRPFCSTDQVFVSFHPGLLGRPLSKPRLSRWVVEAIRQAYASAGVPFPLGVRAHSTRSVATSWALWRGASLSSVCEAATWSSASTFTRFYRLKVASSPSFGDRVLGAFRQ